MRKENILVIVLLALVLAGIYQYNRSESDLGIQESNAATGDLVSENYSEQGSSVDAPKNISWIDYTPGMALAGQEGKNIFLYFNASWCGYCTKLKKETFTDDRIKTYLNDHFVSISVDTDKRGELAQQWGIRGLPTLWFLEPDGTKISNLPGFVNADHLITILQYIHTQSYKTMKFQDYVHQKKS
ncbi:thioredoxin family protein [uncultured Desulfobacter sp.]|uniref:thioredoxin family protein n=1 Tax=uncultured Desulfobacter sp. TaxID=240139 RepID=UPI002AAC32CF|nr:thioredoxin family protein [uncultured Desulfobacter sp.]